MRKYNNFSHYCQYKNNNSLIIITPSVFYHQLLTTHNLAAKHVVALCHFLLSCWRNQASWLGEQCPKLDSMISRPMGAKMVELDYNSAGRTLGLSKDGLKGVLIDLEKAKLLKRVLIKNKWYILLLDEAFKLYLNNNKNKKHRINKGNIISTSWLNIFKTDNGQTDFTGALLVGEITYFSRVFRRKQSDDLQECNEFDSNKQSTLEFSQQLTSSSLIRKQQKLSPSSEDSLKFSDQKCRDVTEDEANVVLVSKSKGLVAYFKHDHFKKKFPFLSSKVIDRTLCRLERNNIISIERKKFMRGRKIIKRAYITLNYELIQKGVNNTVVDFIFKTADYLSSKQLADFCQNTPPSLYNKKYNNKTIIYPSGVDLNIDSFFIQERKNCESDNETLSSFDFSNLLVGKKRTFGKEKSLDELIDTLKRLYKTYFRSFNYPLNFCTQLLYALAKKYPETKFKGENQFISYFRMILAQERKPSWQVKNKGYFGKALGLAELAYDKLPNLLKEKLNKLALQVGRKIEDLPALLSKLAIRNAKHVFSCVSSFLSYMKQVLSKLKSKEEIQEAYSALPRVSISEVASYLSAVEASYSRIGPQEHLRRKLASTLPMTVAYHLLSCCNFYSAKVDKDKNFIIPSKNKNWSEMIRGGIKNIIKDQVSAVYGQIKAIKFIQVLRKEEVPKEKKLLGDTCENKTSLNINVKEVKVFSKATQEQFTIADAKTANKPNNHHSIKPKITAYELFQQRRIQEEQRESKELEAKLREEEQELKNNNANPEAYERYKQVVEETKTEKKNYLQHGGSNELARKLYKLLSFREWTELQELLEFA